MHHTATTQDNTGTLKMYRYREAGKLTGKFILLFCQNNSCRWTGGKKKAKKKDWSKLLKLPVLLQEDLSCRAARGKLPDCRRAAALPIPWRQQWLEPLTAMHLFSEEQLVLSEQWKRFQVRMEKLCASFSVIKGRLGDLTACYSQSPGAQGKIF